MKPTPPTNQRQPAALSSGEIRSTIQILLASHGPVAITLAATRNPAVVMIAIAMLGG